MSKLRIGVIGIGHLGAFHVRAYNTIRRKHGAVIGGICDTSRSQVEEVARKYKLNYYLDYHDMLDKVDAVSIAVPTSLHYAVAKDCLAAGLHVLIEKPITKKLEEADELIALAEKKKLLIQVGHIERFNPAVRAIEPYLEKPRFIECQRLGSIKKKGRIKDVGVVLDLMIHDIDIILSLVDSKVSSIEAFGQSTISSHEDIANVRLMFNDGTIADITSSRVTKEEVRKLRIFQENSYILLDYMHREANLFRKTEKGLKKHAIKIKKNEDALEIELGSFIESIKKNTKPIVSGIEGRQALKVALDILGRIHIT